MSAWAGRARPPGPCGEITWRETRAVVGDRWPRIPAAYYPHISLGYAAADAHPADRTAMNVWLSDHGRDEVTLRADRLVLVAQWHDRRRIVWDTIAQVPLGGTTGGATGGAER